MKSTFILLVTLLLGNASFAQNYWKTAQASDFMGDPQIEAHKAQFYQLNIANFKQSLQGAPIKLQHTQFSSIRVVLPLPDGTFEEFLVFEAPIMEAGLMSKFPAIKTYILQSTQSLLTHGRADITPKGFHAMIFDEEGTWFIDPFNQTSNENYIVYNKKDFFTTKPLPTCLVEMDLEDDILLVEQNSSKSLKLANGGTLRTYRIAVSATGEYTQFHGGTVVDGLAAIVTTINRVNAVYERDFSVRLILVSNNDLVVYTNASSDPFVDTNDPSQMLDENRVSLTSVIGNANYDIGHVVGRSGSGLAGFGVVCSSSNFNHKANGTTGISNPIGDPFDIDYVAHEIGHQFRASHTFNGNSGSCNGNISTNSAYEPGSGTTIMAYAGICSPQNTQNNSDDHFHIRSLDRVINFITTTADACAVKTSTGNAIPEVQILNPVGLTIPKSTPFELTALATDVNGDVLTYCWEQFDLGPTGAPNSPTGNAPIFRSFSPTISGTRVFPKITDIINNTQVMGEILPSYSRSLEFKVTARDNVAGAGAVIDETIDLNVDGNSGPFLVSQPNTNITWTAGDTYLVTWDVANTNVAPVSCALVNIYLSLDGGFTYPILLAANEANDGSSAVVAPFALTTKARVKVRAADNVFFDISNQNFSIQFNCANVDPSISISEHPENLTACVNGLAQFSVTAISTELSITGYQWFYNNVLIPGATTSTLIITNAQFMDAGEYYCTAQNGCNTITSNTALLNITDSPIIPVISQSGTQLISSYSGVNQWYLNGELLLGENNDTLHYTQGGVYTVSSLASSCSASSGGFITALKDLSQLTKISIFPNPTKGNIILSLDNFAEEVQLRVSNLLGQEVLASEMFKGNIEIDLQNVAKGYYLLHLQSKEHSSTFKLLKD